MSMPERIAIAAERDGWHEKRLSAALLRRGARVRRVSLSASGFGAVPGGCAVRLDEWDDGVPDAVFVRAIPGGTFEQVTARLSVLHALRECGVVVYNDARAVERTVDKSMTSFLLSRAGVSTPRTWTCESRSEARRVATQELSAGRRLVLKPLFGARGEGLVLLDSPGALPEADACAGVYYLQSYVSAGDGPSKDWRVMVVGGRAVAAMERHSERWITNRARGGQCRPTRLATDMARLAEAATRAVGAAYAGVDLVRDGQGRCLVLEVNGIPAWRGLQQVSRVDLADAIATDLMGRLRPDRLEAVL